MNRCAWRAMGLVVIVGCATPRTYYEDERAVQRRAEYAAREASQKAYDAAMEEYRRSGEAPRVGARPTCDAETEACAEALGSFYGRQGAARELYDRVLLCEAGQDECGSVRADEVAMRKLVQRRWKKDREEAQRREEELAASKRERLRSEEEIRLQDWREIQAEERAAEQSAQESTAREAARSEGAPVVPTASPEWGKYAPQVVAGLRSDHVSCSWAFGETQYINRVQMLEYLKRIGPAASAVIAQAVDSSHGAGAFERMVSDAESAVRGFISRRCVSGL